MKSGKACVMALVLLAIAPLAQGQTYRAVAVDDAGRLSVTRSTGIRFDAPLLHNQKSFSQASLSDDRKTIAWLANDADPSAPDGSGDAIAARLVVYRAGRVLRTFGTEQVFWSWRFANADQDVAFCTGPLHGGADACELHAIDSGRLRAKWNPRTAGDPPPWVTGLSD